MRAWPVGLLIPLLISSGQAASPAGPYWIVAGSFSNPDYAQVQYEAVRRASEAVKRCGFQPFNDFSGKFAGFNEGFDVVAVGGYATRAAAETDLARLRVCVPNIYVRRGRYLGE
ncbi:SPOR domain-containing protein [Methylobacterium sp. WL9]|uniref:SPOR domain-containing protein n=1 Tax=Methylobacterium sp. WL9 TaxID=2603898 RepID=UPI0011CACD86|nr:SPOR domain-containing protein [Methylobacterium sp. WL9]TXN23953.1 SPOR domain-containing protein [Methylobacterium sp. WL9]